MYSVEKCDIAEEILAQMEVQELFNAFNARSQSMYAGSEIYREQIIR